MSAETARVPCQGRAAGPSRAVRTGVGQVRVYREKQVMSVVECDDVVVAMRFGKYARSAPGPGAAG